jgi:uncharacterized RDD family membrane protein YckC
MSYTDSIGRESTGQYRGELSAEHATEPYGVQNWDNERSRYAQDATEPYGVRNWDNERSRYAHWGWRIASSAIDYLIVCLPGSVLIAVSTFFDRGTKGGFPSPAGIALILAGNVIMVAIWLWQMYRQGTTGQTPGKRMVGTRLVSRTDGRPVGFGKAVFRGVAHIADLVPYYLGCVWPLWDRKRQTFADKIANTVVLKE